jgi:hypothetical protein
MLATFAECAHPGWALAVAEQQYIPIRGERDSLFGTGRVHRSLSGACRKPALSKVEEDLA